MLVVLAIAAIEIVTSLVISRCGSSHRTGKRAIKRSCSGPLSPLCAAMEVVPFSRSGGVVTSERQFPCAGLVAVEVMVHETGGAGVP